MAIKELLSVLPFNYNVNVSTYFYSGMVLARVGSGTSAYVLAADRSLHTSNQIMGVSSDDHAKTGVTWIMADPVGSTYIDGNGVLQAANNAWYVGPKRGLADNAAFDETIENVTNLTAGYSGNQAPMRGVGVFQTPGQFVLDQFVLFQTNDTSASSTADIAFASNQSFFTNDLLTYGVGVNAGKLVKVASPQLNNGKVVAVVDNYDVNAGLLYVSLR